MHQLRLYTKHIQKKTVSRLTISRLRVLVFWLSVSLYAIILKRSVAVILYIVNVILFIDAFTPQLYPFASPEYCISDHNVAIM